MKTTIMCGLVLSCLAMLLAVNGRAAAVADAHIPAGYSGVTSVTLSLIDCSAYQSGNTTIFALDGGEQVTLRVELNGTNLGTTQPDNFKGALTCDAVSGGPANFAEEEEYFDMRGTPWFDGERQVTMPGNTPSPVPNIAGQYTLRAWVWSWTGTTWEKVYSNTLTVFVVTVDELEYDSGSETFVTVPDPLIVPVGAAVTFKALKTPDTAPQWPNDKPAWTKDPGQEDLGTGETKNVAFNAPGTYTVTAECGNSEDAHIRVVEVEKLRYKFGAMESFVNAPRMPAFLYVPVGTEVTFKAIPNPAGDWPEEKPVWSGATPTATIGEATHLFEVVGGPFTVSAECGNSEAVEIIVVEFELSPSISITFPKYVFNSGDVTVATITIHGRTNGQPVTASVTGPGLAQSTVDVTSGSGTVMVTLPTVTLPTESEEFIYGTSATINGIGVSDSKTVTVTANRPPVAIDGAEETDQHTPIQIVFQATDPDDDPLTFEPESPYTYTPPSNFFGVDVITFTVSDGRGGVDTGTVTITVYPVNDPPIAFDAEVETDEDVPVTITLRGYDPNDDEITPSIVTGPSHGALGEIDPETHEVTYTPSPDWFGTDFFTFIMNDGQLDSAPATVTIIVHPVGDLVSLTVVRYLLADGVDSATVSVMVVDGNNEPQEDVEVTLSTTGGTLTDTLLITDEFGYASTTLTSSTTPGDVVVTATIEGDTDRKVVTFFTFKLQVDDAIRVPDTSPPMSVAALGEAEEVVTVWLVTTPAIDLDHADVGLSWTGGDGEENDHRTVPKDVSGQTAVSATLRASTQSVSVVVIEVTEIAAVSESLDIIADNPYDPGTKHAVTTYSATPETTAVFRAVVSPDVEEVYPLYTRLLRWSGGDAGVTPDQRTISRNAPSKTELRVTCGASSDEVIAWVARVSLSIADVPDDEKATTPATIYINSDDDDLNSTPDLNDNVVEGENDLVPLTITLEPAGIGGELVLTHGEKVAVYRHHDKSGTLPGNLTWNLSTRLDANPSNDETPPYQVWVEGRSISNEIGDQIFTLTHEWGDIVSQDSVIATVEARAGDSEVSLHVCSPAWDGQGRLIPGPEKDDPIGGWMLIALQIKLGPGERLDPSVQTITVEAQDDYPYTRMPPAAFTSTWNVKSAFQWWELVNPGTPQAEWVPASTAPGSTDGNREGGVPKIYRGLAAWNTPFSPSLPFTPPMGHNGRHTLRVAQVNGVDGNEVAFQHFTVPAWEDPYTVKVASRRAVVKNLVITNVRTSNGTQDYFKYDPDANSPHNRPTISFTIEDEGDPHEYDAYILMWPTSVTTSLFQGFTTADAVAWTEDMHLGVGPVSRTWDGSLIPEDWAGHAPDGSVKSTYALEVMVFEYKDAYATRGEYIDWFYMRWPYCLSVGEHEVWVNFGTAEEESEMRCKYELHDYANTHSYSVYEERRTVQVVTFNNLLDELTSPTDVDTSLGIMHGESGLGVLICTSDELVGIPRAVFIGDPDYSRRA